MAIDRASLVAELVTATYNLALKASGPDLATLAPALALVMFDLSTESD